MRTRAIALAIVTVLAAGSAVPAEAPAAPVHAARHHARTLRMGMHGHAVRKLQRLLRKRGFRVSVDGWFGRRTRRAVKRAQRAYGLTVDGVAGPATQRALRRARPGTGGAVVGGGTGSGTSACSSEPGSGDNVTRWTPVVKCVLGMLDVSATKTNVNDVLIVIRYESSGNPDAKNDTDVNAQNGDPSRGLMQTIGATFKSYRSSQLPNDIFDPAANIFAGLNYGIQRYGSIANIPGVKSINAGGGYRPYKPVVG